MISSTATRSRLMLVGATLLPVAVVGYFTANSGFYWDDLINFRQAQVEGLSLRYLVQPTSAHFAPGHRLGDWIVQALFPMRFPAAQALMLAGFAATLLLFYCLLVELFGRRRLMLLLTFLYGLSTIHVEVLQWWASGLDRLPATALTFGSMWTYVRFFRSGSRRALGLSVGAFVVALLFYVKPVFIPLYLVLLRILLLDPDETIPQALAATFREWRIWLLYLVPVALYVPVYVHGYSTLQQPSAGLLSQYVYLSWFRVIAPGFFALYIPKHSSTALWVTGVVVGQAALAVLVVWSVRRVPGAWRSWLFFAVTFLVNVVAVGLTRVGLFSPMFVAYVLTYHLEIGYLFVIAVAAICARRVPVGHSSPGVGLSARWSQVNGRAVVTTAVAAYVGLALLGGSRVRHEYTWFGTPARHYVDAVARGLRQARSSAGQELELVNGTVPYRVVPDLAGIYNSESQVLALIDDHVSFQALHPELVEVAVDGTVRRVAFTADVGGTAQELLKGGSLAVLRGAATSSTGPDLCVRSPSETGIVVLAPPGRLAGTGWNLRMSITAGTRQTVGLVTEPLPGDGSPKIRLLQLDGHGRQVEVLPLESPTLQRVYLVLSPGTEACLQRLELGHLRPRP